MVIRFEDPAVGKLPVHQPDQEHHFPLQPLRLVDRGKRDLFVVLLGACRRSARRRRCSSGRAGRGTPGCHRSSPPYCDELLDVAAAVLVVLEAGLQILVIDALQHAEDHVRRPWRIRRPGSVRPACSRAAPNASRPSSARLNRDRIRPLRRLRSLVSPSACQPCLPQLFAPRPARSRAAAAPSA